MNDNGPGPHLARSAPVPGSRLSRLVRLGSLATGVAGGMLAEGARQLARGQRPRIRDMLLTPGNARQVTEQLARLRGAAMKVGQLLSMDAGELLPPELSEILAQLRAEARPMPMSQVVQVLDASWGPGWDRHFSRFSFTPMAAASIGQVHQALTVDGQPLAIKIQYPGVRQSIDSDVDNVALLLRLSGLLPKELDFAPLLQEAKRQLHDEADYLREADCLRHFGRLLNGAPEFVLPQVFDPLTTGNVLAMSLVGGVAIESLHSAPQPERDRTAGLLIGLLLRELFEFRFIQTDPNFANYRFDAASGQLILLDFGAARPFPAALAEGLRQLLHSTCRADRAGMDRAALTLGYYTQDIAAHHRRAVLELFELACEPLRQPGPYDFGRSDLAARMRDAGMALGMDRDFWHTPPADMLFLHRKLGGLYLLAARLQARVDVGRLLAELDATSPAADHGAGQRSGF